MYIKLGNLKKSNLKCFLSRIIFRNINIKFLKKINSLPDLSTFGTSRMNGKARMPKKIPLFFLFHIRAGV